MRKLFGLVALLLVSTAVGADSGPPPQTGALKSCDLIFSTDQTGDFSDGVVLSIDSDTGKVMQRVRDITIRIPAKGKPMAKLVSFDGLFAPDNGTGTDTEYRYVAHIKCLDKESFKALINGGVAGTAEKPLEGGVLSSQPKH